MDSIALLRGTVPASVAVGVLLLAPGPLRADSIVNGGFEQGSGPPGLFNIPGWDPRPGSGGDAYVTTALDVPGEPTWTPVEGERFGVLAPAGDDPFGFPRPVVLRQDFDATAGDVVRGSIRLMVSTTGFGAGVVAFLSPDDPGRFDVVLLEAATTPDWVSWSYTIPQTGRYTLSLAANRFRFPLPPETADVVLAVDAISLTPIPEPSSLALCGMAAVAALGWARARRRRRRRAGR